MIHSAYIPANGKPSLDISYEAIRSALSEPDSLLWVSLEDPNESEYAILSDVFDFHPLTIEDCKSVGYQSPKVDDYGAYLFMIFHAIKSNQDLTSLESRELNLYLGQNYLVTVYQGEPLSLIANVFKRLQQDGRLYHYGADFLCHAVLDALVDEYMPVIDQLDDQIEWLEDQVLSKPNPTTIQRIIDLKHAIVNLRRIVSPMREVINRLSRDDFPMIDRQSRIYFRDIYDHLVRIQDLSDTIRDIASGTMDIYLNSTSMRLNEVMKALTIVSTIFLPLSFVAGVYGMNFEINWPPFSWPGGIIYFWGICVAVAGGMLIWFRRRGWF